MAKRRILCILLLGFLAIFDTFICDESLDDEWESFKSTYSKSYESEAEEVYRKSIYTENRKLIDRHNELYYDGLVSYELALNAYSDLSDSEFSTQMKGHKHYVGRNKRYNFVGAGTLFTGSSNSIIPEHVDWRDKGAVTEIKNQNPCGSCYAFAAVGALEAQHFIKTGKLVTFSEQNLIDCSHPYGNAGCDGGWIDFAFQYIKENVGIAVEAKYPYEAKDSVCRYDPKSSGTTVNDYVFIPEGDEKKLTEAIATVGPISVYIDATGWSFRHLSEGIYSNENCNPNHLDHAVLAVGYGTNENGEDYYIIKNSWGVSWGQDGFIKMARNKNNSCGIATSAVYPII